MPILFSILRYSLNCPLRNSISTSNTLLPDKAIAHARLSATKDFPSPLTVEVIIITLLVVPASLNKRFVRKVLNCSATAVRDSLVTTTGLWDFVLLISAMSGAAVEDTISDGLVTLLLFNSFISIATDVIKIPKNIAAAIIINLLGQYGNT